MKIYPRVIFVRWKFKDISIENAGNEVAWNKFIEKLGLEGNDM